MKIQAAKIAGGNSIGTPRATEWIRDHLGLRGDYPSIWRFDRVSSGKRCNVPAGVPLWLAWLNPIKRGAAGEQIDNQLPLSGSGASANSFAF